jgi:hypothetical protein
MECLINAANALYLFAYFARDMRRLRALTISSCCVLRQDDSRRSGADNTSTCAETWGWRCMAPALARRSDSPAPGEIAGSGTSS